MKKLSVRLLCAALALTTLLSASPVFAEDAPAASAAPTESAAPVESSAPVVPAAPVVSPAPTESAAPAAQYSDASGHWAEQTLLRAAGDGYIAGYAGKLTPNAPINRAQAATMLNRVLSASSVAELPAGSNVPADAWYYTELEKAVYLGYLNAANDALMKAPMKRSEAFVVLSRAFGLTEAQPDYSALSVYADAGALTGEAKAAAASLVSDGFVSGANGSLQPGRTVTRAEFLTLLYRIIDGCALYGCAAADAALPESGIAVVRCSRLKSLTAKGAYNTVALCQGAGDAVFSPASADKVIVGAGSGADVLSGKLKSLQITGTGRTVTLKSGADSAAVSAANVTVTVPSGTAVRDLCVLAGADNCSITVDGTVEKLTVAARGCTIKGSGRVNAADIAGAECSASVRAASPDFDLTAPETLPAGSALAVTAAFKGSGAQSGCVLQWFTDGIAAADGRTEGFEVKNGAVCEYSPKITYVKNLPGKLTVGLSVTYCSGGVLESAYKTADVKLENYPAEHYRASETARVNALVTSYQFAAKMLYDGFLYKNSNLRERLCWVGKGTAVTCVASVGRSAAEVMLPGGTVGWTGYNTIKRGSGNYTRGEDYSQEDKELWVSVKGYASSTQYLVWASLACQRVNVFTKSDGQWRLFKVFKCASGANVTPTPAGVYKVCYKQARWAYNTYWCGPVTGFSGNFAFHSWLTKYDGTAYDHTMGAPASHGCIRMEDAGARYMYTLPMGTTVVVF